MQEKRSKGLCFRCDEKFRPGHHCKQKELQVLWVLDDEELNGNREMANPFVAEQMLLSDSATNLIDDSSPPLLSLSSMVGLPVPQSLKIRGRIGDREVVVLIDSRASHNFIAAALVKELGLPLAPTKDFGLVLGTEDEITTTGICR